MHYYQICKSQLMAKQKFTFFNPPSMNLTGISVTKRDMYHYVTSCFRNNLQIKIVSTVCVHCSGGFDTCLILTKRDWTSLSEYLFYIFNWNILQKTRTMPLLFQKLWRVPCRCLLKRFSKIYKTQTSHNLIKQFGT